MPGVAAFDFDGTLARGDSLLPFLARVAGRGALARGLTAGSPGLALALLGFGDRDRAKAALLSRLLRGVRAQDLYDAGRRYAVSLENRLRPDTLARVAWHRQQGHLLVVVSASLHAYLDPLGDRLGFDAVLATRLEVDPLTGCLTGGIEGANVRGGEKAVRLRHWLEGLPPSPAGEGLELWAYGDSKGDGELLAMADHPVRVRRR